MRCVVVFYHSIVGIVRHLRAGLIYLQFRNKHKNVEIFVCLKRFLIFGQNYLLFSKNLEETLWVLTFDLLMIYKRAIRRLIYARCIEYLIYNVLLLLIPGVLEY